MSETEILVSYGGARFACKDGPLFGNHFATIDVSSRQLLEIGRQILYHGAANFEIR